MNSSLILHVITPHSSIKLKNLFPESALIEICTEWLSLRGTWSFANVLILQTEMRPGGVIGGSLNTPLVNGSVVASAAYKWTLPFAMMFLRRYKPPPPPPPLAPGLK